MVKWIDINVVVVIELCVHCGDQTSTTRRSTGRCGAIMVVKMYGVDGVRGRDKMIAITLINCRACRHVNHSHNIHHLHSATTTMRHGTTTIQ